jgi:hypothetical protein
MARDTDKPEKPRPIAPIERRYGAILAEGFACHEALSPLVPPAEQAKRRGRVPQWVGHNLLFRFQNRRQNVLRFLHDPTVPFTNNLAEQDGRMMKMEQKICGGFRSEYGAEDFGIIRTPISTARKQGWNLLETPTRAPEKLTKSLRQLHRLHFSLSGVGQYHCVDGPRSTNRRAAAAKGAGGAGHVPGGHHRAAAGHYDGRRNLDLRPSSHEDRAPAAADGARMSGSLADESLASAGQLRLTWLRFKRHKLAFISLFIVALF